MQGTNDVDEPTVAENVIDLDYDDRLHDVIVDQVNIVFEPDTNSTPQIVGISDHQWNCGTLELLCLYDSGEKKWNPFEIFQADEPISLSKYIDRNKIGDSSKAQLIKRWSHVYKRALWRFFKSCIKSNCFKFYFGSYHPTSKVLLSHRIPPYQ